jgi:hypothetical protein
MHQLAFSDEASGEEVLVKLFDRFRGAKDPWDDIETSAKLYRVNREADRGNANERSQSDLFDRLRQNPPQDFGQIARLIQLVTEKPVILTPLRCERCGANLEVPTSGQYVQCTHCGYNYHATNVIEMLEKILR